MNKEIMKKFIDRQSKEKYFNIDMKNFSLPVVEKFDSFYYSSLKNGLERYSDYINSLDDFSSELKDNVKQNVNLIIKSIEHYYNAQLGEAKNCILNIINNYVNNNFIISKLKDSHVFNEYKREDYSINPFYMGDIKPIGLFRGRISVEKLNRKDMLHIPLEKRGLVSTNRFSMPGIPCIYLATSTYCCWLELNMPSRYMLYVSSIQIPRDILILNLAISPHFINDMRVCYDDKDISFLEEMLEIFPLVYATSYNILDQNRSFKSEYIVSHLIMQCMKELGIDAVAYFSKKISDETAYPHAINIAIPVERDFRQENNYWLKSKEVFLSEPISYNDFVEEWGYNINTDMLNGFDYSNYIDVLGNPVDFNTLKFSVFDKYLTSLEHKQFKE